MLGEAGAARAQQAEKHAAQREVLESDLRKLNVLYAEAESKAELASREVRQPAAPAQRPAPTHASADKGLTCRRTGLFVGWQKGRGLRFHMRGRRLA